MSDKIIQLDEWSFHREEPEPWQAPELAVSFFVGRCYGHPRHPDGKQIQTSAVTGAVVGPGGDVLVLTHSGSRYRLGDPHPDYEKAYPGARRRIIKAMKPEKP